MTYPPPTAATGDYSSHTDIDATYLPSAAAGPGAPDPGAADEIQNGGRESRRRPIGRLLRRRQPPGGPEAISGSRHRPLDRAERAERAEHPGISWSAARPGLAQVTSEEVNERLADPAHGEPGADRDRLCRVLAGLATRDLTLVESLLLVAPEGPSVAPAVPRPPEVRRAAEPFASGYPVHVIIEDPA